MSLHMFVFGIWYAVRWLFVCVLVSFFVCVIWGTLVGSGMLVCLGSGGLGLRVGRGCWFVFFICVGCRALYCFVCLGVCVLSCLCVVLLGVYGLGFVGYLFYVARTLR